MTPAADFDPIGVALLVTQAFDALGIAHTVGGSIASSYAGEPRSTVDIDIVFYGDRVISVPEQLHVPHLLAHERAFVLRPLADLAPGFEHPTLYRTVSDLLEDLPDDHDIRRADFSIRWFED